MNSLSIVINDLHLVIDYYDKIKIYRANAEAGPWDTELTDVDTRMDLIAEKRVYYFQDDTGLSTHWYKTSYYHSISTDESELSSARLGGTEAEKIGYSFNNYSPPSDLWGKVITADDLRWTYMWGIDCTASDIAETEMEDEQFDYYINAALVDFERFLTIDIRKKVYKTNPDAALVQSRFWREGVDYTDEEDSYPFDPKLWTNFGFVQLRHKPVISIDRAILNSPVQSEVMDLIDRNWVRLQKKTGQVNLFPTGGMSYGPYAVGAMPWRMLGYRFPQGFEFDYTTGYKSSDFVPDDLREVIAKFATIKTLQSVGDGVMAGLSSQSVSLDGLSESFSSTQSATSAYFGARILSYTKEIEVWLKRNRHKWGAIPMSFVGV